jgi:hypothetical protein
MQEYPPVVSLDLFAADHQLTIFYRDGQVGFCKTGDGQRNAKSMVAGLLDVEGGIAAHVGFCGAFNQPFKLFKSQKEGMGAECQFCHLRALELSDNRKRPETRQRSFFQYGQQFRRLQVCRGNE